jgi:hypothetical protein
MNEPNNTIDFAESEIMASEKGDVAEQSNEPESKWVTDGARLLIIVSDVLGA